MIPKQQAAADAGITYRQINHWDKAGYIHVTYTDAAGNPVPARGSMNGYRAWLTRSEHRVLLTMGRLVAAGVRPDAAAAAARAIGDGSEAVLAPGIRIVVEAAA